MRLRELLQESKESGWDHLHKTYPDLKFQHDPKLLSTEREGSWHHDENLNTIIHLHKDVVNRDYQTKSKEKFHTLYHHPLTGIVPHERDEGNITLRLMKGEHQQVYKEYPKFKEHKMAKHIGGTYEEGIRRDHPPRTDSHLKMLAKHNPKYFYSLGDHYGGIAHDVITSSDRKAYDKIAYSGE